MKRCVKYHGRPALTDEKCATPASESLLNSFDASNYIGSFLFFCCFFLRRAGSHTGEKRLAVSSYRQMKRPPVADARSGRLRNRNRPSLKRGHWCSLSLTLPPSIIGHRTAIKTCPPVSCHVSPPTFTLVLKNNNPMLFW